MNPYEGEILSVALVKMNGEKLYLELEYDGPVSDWVKENILPKLTSPKVSRVEAVEKIKEFVGDSHPYAVSYVNQFDTLYLYKLCGTDGHPFHWLPVDFASMLFSEGMDPNDYYEDGAPLLKKLGIDPGKYNYHHALDDARLLKEIYLKLVGTR